MIQLYKLPQGKISIIHSSKDVSVGYLELNPHSELKIHNRPVNEELFQLVGSCEIKEFQGDRLINTVTMDENQRYVIEANKYHIHSNPTDSKSITIWNFEGDIVDIIQDIRDNCEQEQI
jgi:hypothetical protein